MKEENNNPIKESESDIISKIITHTLGDEDVEYADDNNNYHNKDYYDENFKKRKWLLLLPVFVFFVMCIDMMIISNVTNVEEKREFNELTASGFTCNSGIVIPTLYKYTGYNKCVTSIKTLNDTRFKKSNTIESTYTVPISDLNITLYIDGLTKEEFYYVGEYEGDRVYVKEERRRYEGGSTTLTNKYYNVYAFVILSKERIIYGEGTGSYKELFDI